MLNLSSHCRLDHGVNGEATGQAGVGLLNWRFLQLGSILQIFFTAIDRLPLKLDSRYLANIMWPMCYKINPFHRDTRTFSDRDFFSQSRSQTDGRDLTDFQRQFHWRRRQLNDSVSVTCRRPSDGHWHSNSRLECSLWNSGCSQTSKSFIIVKYTLLACFTDVVALCHGSQIAQVPLSLNDAVYIWCNLLQLEILEYLSLESSDA